MRFCCSGLLLDTRRSDAYTAGRDNKGKMELRDLCARWLRGGNIFTAGRGHTVSLAAVFVLSAAANAPTSYARVPGGGARDAGARGDRGGDASAADDTVRDATHGRPRLRTPSSTCRLNSPRPEQYPTAKRQSKLWSEFSSSSVLPFTL
jgi:hypothetical protein